jgi:hypothetical protein
MSEQKDHTEEWDQEEEEEMDKKDIQYHMLLNLCEDGGAGEYDDFQKALVRLIHCDMPEHRPTILSMAILHDPDKYNYIMDVVTDRTTVDVGHKYYRELVAYVKRYCIKPFDTIRNCAIIVLIDRGINISQYLFPDDNIDDCEDKTCLDMFYSDMIESVVDLSLEGDAFISKANKFCSIYGARTIVSDMSTISDNTPMIVTELVGQYAELKTEFIHLVNRYSDDDLIYMIKFTTSIIASHLGRVLG